MAGSNIWQSNSYNYPGTHEKDTSTEEILQNANMFSGQLGSCTWFFFKIKL